MAAKPWTQEASNNVAECVALMKALEKIRLLHLEDSEMATKSAKAVMVFIS